MRMFGYLAATALLSCSTVAAASADYYLQIKRVGRDSVAGPIYLDAVSTGDLDGDGIADEAIVRLVCAGGELRSAEYSVKAPRDLATGQSSGKRMHKPLTVIKEWGPGTPLLMTMKPTYDVKKVEGSGAKTMSEDSWTHIRLANADGLCAAAEASVQINKSKSNVKNN